MSGILLPRHSFFFFFFESSLLSTVRSLQDISKPVTYKGGNLVVKI
jgi:hypothetical protein